MQKKYVCVRGFEKIFFALVFHIIILITYYYYKPKLEELDGLAVYALGM
jgi:hypothetical protein